MILDSEVLVKSKYNYSLDYYKSLGYNIEQDFFMVKIEDLPKNSFTVVKVSCDYCDNISNISYYKWNRSMTSLGKYACSKKCVVEKTRESNLLKYGVTSLSKLDKTKDKIKDTNRIKYGVDYVFKSEEVKSKIKATNLDRYGVDNPLKSDKVKERIKSTNLDRYGVDNISKLDSIKEKKADTTFKNWGVYIPLKSDIIKEKVKLTNLTKYGNQYFVKSEIFRKSNYNIANDEFYLNYIDNGISLFKCDCSKDHDFEISKDVYSKRILYNVSLCTICNPIDDNNSIKEKNLYEYIVSIYSGEIIRSWRLNNKEIDIYLPDLNIGFEFNGLYWHSDKYKDSNFHINKKNFFKENGINLFHIWEDDWDYKGDIIKSQIENSIGLSKNKIWARKCKIVVLNDNKVIRDFLNNNHIQGKVNSVVKIGLYYDNELVSLMTFDNFEGRKRMEDGGWNLSRFCSLLNTSVIGGASKLLNYFMKTYNPSRIVSYADKDWSVGNLYYKLGFQNIKESKPDYKYIINGKRVHKSGFRKSFTGISESNRNINKIWDCGKIKFQIIF